MNQTAHPQRLELLVQVNAAHGYGESPTLGDISGFPKMDRDELALFNQAFKMAAQTGAAVVTSTTEQGAVRWRYARVEGPEVVQKVYADLLGGDQPTSIKSVYELTKA